MEFTPLGNASSPFSRSITGVKLLVKVVGSSTIDAGSIPGTSQLSQKSGVGQEIYIYN